jgi:hypothetical protein
MFKALVYGLLLGEDPGRLSIMKLMIVLLGPLSESAKAVYKGTASSSTVAITSTLLVLIMASTSILALSSAGIEVAIERDWYVMTLFHDMD